MMEIRMPQLGLTMTEGTVTRWLKAEGESVAKGEILYEVETDKLTNEVPSDIDGVVRKIVAPEGSEIPVQGLLAFVGDADEPVPDIEAGAPSAPAGETSAVPEAKSETPVAATVPGGRIHASGLAKKIAREKGVDLAQVRGTGPGGRIIAADVEAAEAAPATAAAQPAPVTSVAGGHTRTEQMSGMRKAISRNMLASWTSIPVVHYNLTADTTTVAELKAKILDRDGVKVTYTDILAKLLAKALIDFPELNSSVDGETITYHEYVNLGIAVALPDGLVVPVIQNAHLKGITEIASESKELAARARSGGLSQLDMEGGTFTISNIGMYGIDTFTPIVNGTEAAILGVGTITKTPIVTSDDEIIIRPMMSLSLTADHRVADGAVAAAFLGRLKAYIEDPMRTLL